MEAARTADGGLSIYGHVHRITRSGERVALSELDWSRLDALHELEIEIVGARSSRCVASIDCQTLELWQTPI